MKYHARHLHTLSSEELETALKNNIRGSSKNLHSCSGGSTSTLKVELDMEKAFLNKRDTKFYAKINLEEDLEFKEVLI